MPPFSLRLRSRGCRYPACWHSASLLGRFEAYSEALALTADEVKSAETTAMTLGTLIKSATVERQKKSHPRSPGRGLVFVGAMLTGSVASGSAIFLSHDVDMLCLYHSLTGRRFGADSIREELTDIASNDSRLRILKDQSFGMTVSFEGQELDVCMGLLNVDHSGSHFARTTSLTRYRTWLAKQLPRSVVQAVRVLKAWLYSLGLDTLVCIPFHSYCLQALATAVFLQHDCNDLVSISVRVWSLIGEMRDDGDMCLHVNVAASPPLQWLKPPFQQAPRCVITDPFTGLNVVTKKGGLTYLATAARHAADLATRLEIIDPLARILVDAGLPDVQVRILKRRLSEVTGDLQCSTPCRDERSRDLVQEVAGPRDRRSFLQALGTLLVDGRLTSGSECPSVESSCPNSSHSRTVGSAVPLRLRVSSAELDIRYERVFERLSFEFDAQGQDGLPERLQSLEYMQAMVEAYVVRDFVLSRDCDIFEFLAKYARKLSHLYGTGELCQDLGPHVLSIFLESGDLETFYFSLGCEAVEALGY